jgi:hypothetical protein
MYFLFVKKKARDGPVRLAYQPPANSTFLSQQTSQQYSSLRTNQHQPSATSQPKMLSIPLAQQLPNCMPRPVGARQNK